MNILSYLTYGAGRGGRTPTRLPSADFESAASASSAIPAYPSTTQNAESHSHLLCHVLISARTMRPYFPSSIAYQPHRSLNSATATPHRALRWSRQTSPAQSASIPLPQRHTQSVFSEEPHRYASRSTRRRQSQSHPGREY